MRRIRRAPVGGAAIALAAAGLAVGGALPAGAESVSGEFGATCSTSPPVPHQNFGVIGMVADVPTEVVSGAAFTITVTGLAGAPGPPPGAGQTTGASFAVEGGVEPSGLFGFGTATQTYAFRATGQPGEAITVGPRGVNGLVGTFPNAFSYSCSPSGTLATITITPPPECLGQPATIVGSEQVEVLTGTAGPDVIHALGGDDTIAGLAGDDLVCGGGGMDTVDHTLASSGVIVVLGGDAPFAVGGDGHDRLDGIESATGSAFVDGLLGDDGPNRLVGGRRGDLLVGLAGDDTLTGGGGVDVALGGAGTDTSTGELRAGCEG